MTKIIVPTFIEYNTCQLTTDNLDNFLNFISKYTYKDSIHITYKYCKEKQIPIEIEIR